MASQGQASIAAARMPPPQRRDAWSVLPVAVACIIACPVAVVVGYAFVPAGEVWAHLADTVLSRYVANTVVLIVSVAAATFVVGVGTAWLVSMARFPLRGVFEWALVLPFALPAYVLAYTYTGLLDVGGPVQEFLRDGLGFSGVARWFPGIRSLAGTAAMMTLALYPYVYLLARAAFLDQSVCALEIGRTLGRGAWRGFAGIALPLARPALAGGVALALMEALSDFGTVDYYGVDTFATGIYRTWFALGDAGAAAQLSAVLLIFVFLVLAAERWQRRRARYHHTTGRAGRAFAWRLSGWRAGLAAAACFAPLALGFLLPAGRLAAWAVPTWRDRADAAFGALAGTSFLLAALTALLAVAAALAIAYAARLGLGPVGRAARRIAGLGYAVPGSVVAVGALLSLAWIDHRIDDFARSVFGVSTGLIVTGGIAALVFAYLVRFLAVSMNAVDAAFVRVTGHMDDAARTLGAAPARVLGRIHLPMLRGGLLTATLLVFVDTMKELPATLILRPFDVNTLAVRAYELASDERLADAATPALAIVAAGLVPVALLGRAVARGRA